MSQNNESKPIPGTNNNDCLCSDCVSARIAYERKKHLILREKQKEEYKKTIFDKDI